MMIDTDQPRDGDAATFHTGAAGRETGPQADRRRR
jgi:hypothetical protein